MGKKSKVCKVGNSKKNYGDVMKIKKDKLKYLQNIAKKMTLSQAINETNNKTQSDDESSGNSSDEGNYSKINKTNLNNTIANYDRTNLYDSLMNLNQTSDKVKLTDLNQTFLDYVKENNLNKTKLHQTMADFALKPGEVPLRNRRIKNNAVLSKGQKKRMEKKEKLLKKKLLDEVLRKNKALIINNKSQLNKTNLNMTNIPLNKTNINTPNINEMLVDGEFGNKNVNLDKTLNDNKNINAALKNKKSDFDLLEMNNTLNNMLSDIKKQDNNMEIEKKTIELTKRKKHNVKRLL